MYLVMIALAAGKDIYERFEDNADDGEIAMHLDDDTVTESQDFLQGYFEQNGPSSTRRNLQAARAMRVLRLLPFLGAICIVCAIAGIGAKFFLSQGRTGGDASAAAPNTVGA